ncbi:MAG: hypothetical protein HZA30_05295 [Candidatus Omnitrophica bacterium]|nr:hypothetical protein [Candidatus Omnitrophota bacterium]
MRSISLRIILLSLISLTLLLTSSPTGILAEAPADNPIDSFLVDLKDYFLSYYSSVKAGLIRPKDEVLRDIEMMAEGLLNLKGEATHIDSIDDFSLLLDKEMKPYKKSINIFLVGQSDIVNCWLGDRTEEKIEIRNVWGKDLNCIVKVLDRLTIQDYKYFSTEGKEALDAGTRAGIIYYNLDAYRARASSLWDFIRGSEKKKRGYDPSRANRLRRRLSLKTWRGLYSDTVNFSDDPDKAKALFIERTVELLRETSLLHEMGHIFAEKELKINNAAREEEIAFLIELRYGPLPYESLDMVVSAGYQSSITDYNSAGRKITGSFIAYIKEEKKKGNPAYRDIDIREMGQVRMMENLFKLTEDEIRSISEYIFKNFIKFIDKEGIK